MSATPPSAPKSRLGECLKFVLEQEGGYSDDAGDPGGRTNLGIIEKEYLAYRHHKGLAPHDVDHTHPSLKEATEIYQFQYWIPLACAHLPPGVDLAVFDTGVNLGIVRAAGWLQAVLGVSQDGHLGLVTLHALAQHADQGALVTAFLAERQAQYDRDRDNGQSQFYRGWCARMNSLRTAVHNTLVAERAGKSA